MKFIGRIVKQTAQLEYKKNLHSNLDFDCQIDVLSKLLKKTKKTAFGKAYNIDTFYKIPNPIREFQSAIPIVDYEEFYHQWLHKTIEGQRSVCWPGKINYFALSSGTTGAPSKKIPVSKQMIRSFQKTSIKQITTLCQLDLPTEFYQKQVLVVGGSTKLEDMGEYLQGDLSGILKKNTKKIATPFTKPSNKISDIKDWYKKLEKIVEEAPKWDIGIIAGIPSWCVLLLEEIVKVHRLNSIHDIWPNLKIYIHGGVFIEPYSKRLDNLCKQPLYLFDTYLASEGYFAYQQNVHDKSMELLINNGIFYEFIPYNKEYFDVEGKLKDRHSALTLQQVEEGINYALVISTNAGLWRYMLGDTIQFTNVAKREIKITGRTKQYLSLAGEHLSLDNIHTGLQLTSKKLGAQIEEFTVVADQEQHCHRWYISTNIEVDKDLMINELDKNLSLLNDDYTSARKYTLKQPQLTVLTSAQFYTFLEKAGKLGAQNKFPRVMNTEQHQKWLVHIDEENKS